ncbi:MAG: LysM peptidoglycan-binding domain-containing protein [Anaerolineae bacterium]|nr:LysM peptidoglycan-binding domain-containing protein [Anaerolineae bacterium]
MSLILLFVAVVPVLAQRNCPTIVLDALNQIGDNCTGLNRNAACYGFDRVDSTFFVPQPEGTFSQPTDRANLLDIATLQTYPLDMDTGQFGAAVMNVQANVPNALPGQGVVFLLLGDATIENAVQPESSAKVIDSIPVPVAVDANLYTSPTETANIRLVAPTGELLPIDGLTPQGLWARAIVNDEILWVRTSDLVQSAALNALPTVGSSQRTPMQAFYFSTGIGAPACNEAEPVIAVQSPENITVDLTVNGVDIRVGSLVTFQSIDETSSLVTVHRGSVQTTTGQDINANESAIALLGPDGGVMSWQPPQPITDAGFERGQRVQFALNNVAKTNGWPERDVTPRDLPQPTATPTEVTVIAPTIVPTQDTSTGFTPTCGDVTYVVQPGDNLFRIALNHEASMPAIIEANDLADPNSIFVGQQLRIPNACGGFVGGDLGGGSQEPVPPVTEDPNQGPVSCAGFRLVYPTVEVPVGDTLYEWTPVQGATHYEVVFYDYNGVLAGTYATNGPETSFYWNTGRIPTGSELYWEVRAYDDDTYLCVTPRSGKITRLADPDQIQAPTYSPSFTLASCFFDTGLGVYQATVDWTGAAPGDTIAVQIYDVSGIVTGSNTGIGDFGSIMTGSSATPYKVSAVASVAGGYTEFFPTSC